jgi:hypothetical protein
MVLVFLLFSTALSAFVSQVGAVGTVNIISHTGYLDSLGNYHVVGEVQNVGNQAVTFIQVSARFYDTYNVAIASRFDLTMLNVLLVGRKSPFEIALLDVAESAKVIWYSLSVTYLETSPIPLKLEISAQSSYKDGDGIMHITGNLKNLGNEKLMNAKVVATYYDASSHVIAAALTSFDPELTGEIYPNQTASFEIKLSKEKSQYVTTYALAAESNQYAMIPEFPVNLTWTLFALSSFLAILICRRRTRGTECAGDPGTDYTRRQ